VNTIPAYTYTLASKLPEWVLDGILSLPARLTEIRNKIIPIVSHPEQVKSVANDEEGEEGEEVAVEVEAEGLAPDEPDEKATPASSGYSSEAEMLSISSYDKIAGSWVSLNEQQK
jgi:hypothetical protein